MSYEKDEPGSGCRIRKSYSRKRGYNEYYYDCDEDLGSDETNFFSKKPPTKFPYDYSGQDYDKRIFGMDLVNDKQNITNSEKFEFIFKDLELGFISWMNGDEKNEFTPNADPHQYDSMDYYGTHDWIAESALELLNYLYPKYAKNYDFIRALYYNDDDLKRYFLVGTELPDRHKVNNLKIKIYDNGIVSHDTFPTIDYHELNFDSTGNLIMDKDYLRQGAEEMAVKIEQSFDKKDFRAVSLFLGAMCHYISDATIFNHLIENNERPRYSWNFMNDVNSQTRTLLHPETLRGEKTREPRDQFRQEEFFSITKAHDMVSNYLNENGSLPSMNAGEATINAGRDTLKGNQDLGIMETRLIEMLAPTKLDPRFWPDKFTRDSLKNNPSLSENQVLMRDYFNTIEYNLNVAIFYCIAAINFVLNDT